MLDAGKALHTYVHVFQMIGLWGVGAGLVMLVASPFLKHWAHGASDSRPIAATQDGERQAVGPAPARVD